MNEKIRSAVEESPGIHLRRLEREVGCTTSTLNYHIRRDGELRGRHIRSYRRIYPESVPEELENALAALNHSSRGEILLLVSRSSLTTSRIAEEVGLCISTVSDHLNVLEKEGLVSVRRRGRKKSYSAAPEVMRALRRYGAKVLDGDPAGTRV